MRTVKWTLVLALALALAVAVPGLVSPGSAFGQSAGDEQYVDPFQEDTGDAGQPSGDSGNDSGAGGGQSTPAPAPSESVDGATQDTVPAQPVPEAGGNGAVLPRTGLPLIGTVLAGVALLTGGAALRRRT
jgi:hypothetical protein